MMNQKSLEKIYKQNLDESIVAYLSEQRGISLSDAMDIYYKSRLSMQINEGLYGIENMDYKYLTHDLIDNEPELFE